MQYEWDENKRRINLEKHGEDFADVVLLDWTSAIIRQDDRQDYGEVRYNAFLLRDDGRLMSLTLYPSGKKSANHQLQKSQQSGEKEI